MSDSPIITANDARHLTQRAGLVVGLAVLAIVASLSPFAGFVARAAAELNLPPDHANVAEAARGAQVTLAIILLMLIWWVSEAVPLPATALLPAILLPLLHVTGVRNGALYAFDAQAAMSKYAAPVIYLFLGGFLLAGGMQKTGLDKRITFFVLGLRSVSRNAPRLILAMMAVTAGLSMLISNTATTAMMIPIALGVLTVLDEQPGRSPIGTAMLLGVAWSASLGGIGTLIGSPPNLMAIGILEERGAGTIDMVGWMRIGMPVAVLGVIVAWLLLRVLFKTNRVLGKELLASLRRQGEDLGKTTRREYVVIAVIAFVMLLWLTQRTWETILPPRVYSLIARFNVHEIGLLGGLLLFVIPTDRSGWRPVLNWSDTKYVDWGTLVLFGGGLALSNAMSTTGVTDWIADGLLSRLGNASPWLCLAAVILLVDYLTEIASNTAVTAMIAPLLIAVAPGLGLDPLMLCMAAAMAASLAFMLPVATPPNALVYATGYLRISQMVRAGFLMNLLGCGVLLAILTLLNG